jgi:Na+/H+ antiporter
MAVFELVLSLLLGGVCLSLLAPLLGVPWPSLLALAGTALALVPGVPDIRLDPDLALALFLAPVLLDAAYDASPRDLRDNWVALGSLVLVAVGLTAGAVALTAHWLVPAMPWAAALALGAIVAPPDAAAATAVLRQFRLPHRLMVILEGESLLNDASSLLLYRLAIGAATAGIGLWTAPMAVLAAVGGVLLGVVLARLYFTISVRMPAGAPAMALQFLGTFSVWLLAERLSLSAVLAMVAFAFSMAQLMPGRLAARRRRNSYAVWDIAVFVLNVLAFILVGLQCRHIVAGLGGERARTYAAFAGAVLATTILIRIAWVMALTMVVRWRIRRHGERPSKRRLIPPTIHGGVVIAWCGMRGIVTLAAALALPEGFPYRDLIVFAAFGVVMGTLVLQGMTLRPLLARLTLTRDDSVTEEIALARRAAAQAALDVLGVPSDDAGLLLARHYQARLEETPGGDVTGVEALRRRALAAERICVIQLRHAGRIGDDAYHVVEEELDWAEAALDVV